MRQNVISLTAIKFIGVAIAEECVIAVPAVEVHEAAGNGQVVCVIPVEVSHHVPPRWLPRFRVAVTSSALRGAYTSRLSNRATGWLVLSRFGKCWRAASRPPGRVDCPDQCCEQLPLGGERCEQRAPRVRKPTRLAVWSSSPSATPPACMSWATLRRRLHLNSLGS